MSMRPLVTSLAIVVAGCSPSAAEGIAPAPAPSPQEIEQAPDAAADAVDAADADYAGDEGSPPDAGPDAGPTPVWTTNAPAGFNVTATVGDSECSFEIGWFRTNPGAPTVPTYADRIHKFDTTPGSCPEPKGWIAVAGGGFQITGSPLLARHPTERRLVYAADSKGSPSGSSPTKATIQQIDWVTGRVLRSAALRTKDAPAGPPPNPIPSTSGSALSVTATEMILQGSGWFPGSTGTGTSFEATYVDFLQPFEQPAVAADTATRF